MMADKQYDPKFEPLAGNSYNISPKFNEPKQMEGQYGTYWMLGITVNGKPYTWFLNEKTWEMFTASQMKKGEIGRLDVVQQMGEKGPYNTFALHTKNGVVYSHDQAAKPVGDSPNPYGDGVPLPGEEKPAPEKTDSPPPVDNSIYVDMEKCLMDAIEMADKIHALGDQKDMENCPAYYRPTSEDVRAIAVSMFIQMHR
jgi:hypothetical protein